MPERVNRRDMILEAAARLFMEQGYSATSIRQIAEAVGCTEAALYYHFKEGKRGLLGVVIEAYMPNLLGVVSQCQDATSLEELIRRFGLGMIAEAKYLSSQRLRWVVADFHNFGVDERQVVYERIAAFHDGLTALIRKFVPSDEEAHQLTWMITFLLFGYGQMMIHLELHKVFEFNVDDFMARLVQMLAGEYQR